MFWDRVAGSYDFFETVYNKKVYREFPLKVAEYVTPSDMVLECACGTGVISRCMAENGARVIATDFSVGMLKQAHKKHGHMSNLTFGKADIMRLQFPDETFDKVVAGNVIHLLDNPKAALDELVRVCRKDGCVIVPTYVNKSKTGKPSFIVRLLKFMGIDFKMRFTYDDYINFISSLGYTDAHFCLVKGRMPNAIAVITKK